MGNVLLNFRNENTLTDISVIDWEFVTTGPTFLDVGNFIAELFLISYFESTDSVYVTVFEAFVSAYRSFKVPFDIDSALGLAGAHIMMSLSRRVDSPRSRATRESAIACVDQALKFITDPEFNYVASRKADALENVAQLMRDRRQAM
jgi:hypothetical protein